MREKTLRNEEHDGIALKWRVINISSVLRVSYILSPSAGNSNRMREAEFISRFLGNLDER